jgi:ubiquinone/menaquinone biosynthesis C-methylase UbiE
MFAAMSAASHDTPSHWTKIRYQARHRGLALALNIGVNLWHQLLAPKTPLPTKSEVQATRARFERMLRRDIRNVENGVYPADLLHQFPLTHYASFFPTALQELLRVYLRKRARVSRDVPVDEGDWDYPRYYLQNFHWQTDGWLSDRSAALYDVGVEFLFMGSADIMRRMALKPLIEGLEGHPRNARILDIACGTGRFLAQIRQALPRARLIGLDLSPHYLEHAVGLLGKDPFSQFIQANAEKIPLENASIDAVTSVYLFHELPSDARRNVMKEAFRVLKPGGSFTVCDSAQLEGNEDIQAALQRFPAMYHEPFFKGYLRDDLADLFENAGFQSIHSETHLVSRVLTGLKEA